MNATLKKKLDKLSKKRDELFWQAVEACRIEIQRLCERDNCIFDCGVWHLGMFKQLDDSDSPTHKELDNEIAHPELEELFKLFHDEFGEFPDCWYKNHKWVGL